MKTVFFVFFSFLTTNAELSSSLLHSNSSDEFVASYNYIDDYRKAGISELAFNLAMDKLTQKADSAEKTNLLTIIDFDLPSTYKRFWVIDLQEEEIMFNTYVAHGRKSGQNHAVKFSNQPESHMSSLGLYQTGETYVGKHGLSLYLDGLEAGVNDNARKRYIVMHGADYVSRGFIEKYGRLGRSYGCPALPRENYKEIINLIARGSFLYIHKKECASGLSTNS